MKAKELWMSIKTLLITSEKVKVMYANYISYEWAKAMKQSQHVKPPL